jgi:hypothetical protein
MVTICDMGPQMVDNEIFFHLSNTLIYPIFIH